MPTYTLDITDAMVQDAQKIARQALDATTYSDFKAALLNLNACVRGYGQGEVKEFRTHEEAIDNGGKVIWVGPAHDKVDALLDEAWTKSLTFDSKAKKAGYLYHALHAIHPFKNGNGRAGRALFFAAAAPPATRLQGRGLGKWPLYERGHFFTDWFFG